MGIIYCAQYLEKDKKPIIYIGKTERELEVRKEEHFEGAKACDTDFHETLFRKGIDNWEWIILEKCENEKLTEREKYWIKSFRNKGVILTNTVHNRKKVSSNSNDSSISKKYSGQQAWVNKESLNWHFKRGKLKPVKDLTTGEIFQSLNKAAEASEITRTSIRFSCETGYLAKNNHKYIFCDLQGKELPSSQYDREKAIRKSNKSYSQIKNLNTGKTFDSLKKVSETYSIKEYLIQGVCNGTYKSTIKKLDNNKKISYSFCYVDHSGNDVIKNKHKEFLKELAERESFCVALYDLNDDQYLNPVLFDDIQAIVDDPDITIQSTTHINDVIKGIRTHVQGYRIAKFDKKLKLPILTEKHKTLPKKVLKNITCLNSGEVYKTIAEAARILKLSRQQISACCNGDIYQTGKAKDKEGFRFAFLDKNNKPILTNKHEKYINSLAQIGVPLFCVQLGGIFPSKKNFLEKAREKNIHIPPKTLDKHLDNPEKYDLDGIQVYKLDKNIFD